jgi:hypothetical protein
LPLPQPTEFLEHVHAFDARVDKAVDRHRGNKTLDRAFYMASELADFSLLWHLVGTARGLASKLFQPSGLHLKTRSFYASICL